MKKKLGAWTAIAIGIAAAAGVASNNFMLVFALVFVGIMGGLFVRARWTKG